MATEENIFDANATTTKDFTLPSTAEIPEPYSRAYWIVCESVLVVMTVFCAYLCFCVTRHAIVNRKRKTKNSPTEWQKKWLKILPVIATFTLFLRLCNDHVSAFSAWKTDTLCLVTITVSAVLFTISIYSVYIFLWMRQSIFYANDLMAKLMNKYIVYLSWTTLVVMASCGSVIAVLYNIPQVTKYDYRATVNGCMDVSGENSNEIIPFVFVCFTGIFQIGLLTLFIYPLCSKTFGQYRSKLPKKRNNSNNEASETSSFSHSQENDLGSSKQNKDSDKSISTVSVFKAPDENGNKHDPLGERRRFLKSETDSESGEEFSKDGRRLFTKSPTIKREPTSNPNTLPMNSTVGFNRGRHYSTDSALAISPVTSDSEMRGSKKSRGFGGTIRRVVSRSSKKSERARRTIALMKKYTVLMLVCIATDIGATLIQTFYITAELIYLVTYDINLLINVICIILTYTEWKTILFPFSSGIGKITPQNASYASTNIVKKVSPSKGKKTRVQQLRQESIRIKIWQSRRRSSGGTDYDSDSVFQASPCTRPLPT